MANWAFIVWFFSRVYSSIQQSLQRGNKYGDPKAIAAKERNARLRKCTHFVFVYKAWKTGYKKTKSENFIQL